MNILIIKSKPLEFKMKTGAMGASLNRKASLYRKIGLATLIMTVSILASRVIGLVREVVIAHAGGATADVDAYQISFVLPEILNHIVASGFLSITFIPIFSRYLAEGREKDGWKVFNTILTTMGIPFLVIIAISVYFAPQLVALLAPGIKDPNVLSEAVTMTRIILPAQFFFFTGGLFMAVQFAKEKFYLPAMAPLVYNIGIIAGGIWLEPYLGMVGFSWGVLAGAFVGNFLIQFIGAYRLGLRPVIDWAPGHPDFKKYLLISLPLMLGLTMTFSTEIFFKIFGSFLAPGNIAGLNYSLRVMLMLVAFFGQAVGVASFPFMARLAAQNKMLEMHQLLNNTMRYLALVIPFAVLVMVLRHEIIRVLFQRGAFDAAATHLTAGLLVYILMGAFAFAAQTVVVRGFYALQNTLFPALYGTIAVIISLPMYAIGLRLMGAKGVALAIAISVTLQVIVLFVIWNHRYDNPDSRSVYAFILKTALSSIPLGLMMVWLRKYLVAWIDPISFWESVLIIAVTGSIFCAVLVCAAFLFNIRVIRGFIIRKKTNNLTVD